MYRSEGYFEKAKTFFASKDVPPIFVPSYNRPNPIILQRLTEEPELKIVLCIRREQYEMYKHWEGKVGFLFLDNVSEIGETRREIVRQAMELGLQQMFFFDDDINELEYLIPSLTRGGKEAMRSSHLVTGVLPRWTDVLKTWLLYLYYLDKKVAISAPAYRPDSWFMKNKDADFGYNSGACIQAVWLNLALLKEKEINYKANYEVGNEDYALQFDIMNSGLLATTITDIMYGCPAINSHPGGCENASGYNDPNERYKWYVSVAKEYYKDHPGIKYKVTTRTGIESVKFNFKYWRKVYESSNSK